MTYRSVLIYRICIDHAEELTEADQAAVSLLVNEAVVEEWAGDEIEIISVDLDEELTGDMATEVIS